MSDQTTEFRESKEKVKSFPSLATSLEQALDALEKDQTFLREGGYFPKS